jgi:hypothetical protein
LIGNKQNLLEGIAHHFKADASCGSVSDEPPPFSAVCFGPLTRPKHFSRRSFVVTYSFTAPVIEDT